MVGKDDKKRKIVRSYVRVMTYTVLHLSIRITLPQAIGSEYFKNPS